MDESARSGGATGTDYPTDAGAPKGQGATPDTTGQGRADIYDTPTVPVTPPGYAYSSAEADTPAPFAPGINAPTPTYAATSSSEGSSAPSSPSYPSFTVAPQGANAATVPYAPPQPSSVNEYNEYDEYEEEDEAEQAGQKEPHPSPFSVRALIAWVRLAHPSTLLLSTMPVLVALAALWARGGRFSWPLAACAFFGVGLAHAGANILDEYLEYARRVHTWNHFLDNDPNSAPLLARVPVYHLDALRVSVVVLALGALAGVPLIISGGWRVAVIGVIGLLIAFFYSATNFALKRIPIGDLAVLLALGPGVLAATIFSQRATPTFPEWLLSVGLGCFALAVALVSHLRDPRADVANNYRTLVLLVGERATRVICGFAFFGAFAFTIAAALLPGAAHGVLLAVVALPYTLIALTGAARASSLTTRALAFRSAIRAYATYALALVIGLAATGVYFRILHLLAK